MHAPVLRHVTTAFCDMSQETVELTGAYHLMNRWSLSLVIPQREGDSGLNGGRAGCLRCVCISG